MPRVYEIEWIYVCFSCNIFQTAKNCIADWDIGHLFKIQSQMRGSPLSEQSLENTAACMEWKSLALFSEWAMDADCSEISFQALLLWVMEDFLSFYVLFNIFVMIPLDKWYEKWSFIN